MPTRRKFVIDSSKALAAAGLLTGYTSVGAKKKSTASDTIGIALIGCRNMGFGNLKNAINLPNVECVAMCDADNNVLEERAKEITQLQGRSPARYKDYRQLLNNKDVDAVIIATPDHWHCLIFVAACQAGKDVYVEKPLANSIAECDLMVKTARQYKRVAQVGQQQRSGKHWKDAMSFIHDGNLGTLRKVNVWANFRYGIGQPVVPDSAVPEGVDFDLWLGPAPSRPFNTGRFHGSWRMFWDYGGGLLTDWGVHLIDMALWAKKIDKLPEAVVASGGNFSFSDHAHETFDTMSVAYQLPDYTINWEHTAGVERGPYGRSYGLAYVGDQGTIVADREGWELIPETKDGKNLLEPVTVRKAEGLSSHELHMKNFIDCIRSRKDPECTVENGRLVAAYAHMGNIALRTHSRLEWDIASNRFRNNPEADRFITPSYRRPWSLPKSV